MILKRKNGFSILALILVMVAIITVISIWLLSGQSNISAITTSSSNALASAIISDGFKYKDTYSRYLLQGVDSNNITFQRNTTNSNNLLDPVNGVNWTQINTKSLISGALPNGYWAYNNFSFFGSNLGTSSQDNTVLVVGISDQVCSEINRILYNNPTIPVFNDGNSYVVNKNVTMTNAYNYNYIYMHSFTTIDSWVNGCVNHNGNANENFYFQVLSIN